MGLTNTYFTGEAPGYKRGRSKQKRNDCPLVAMGLILDEKGFVKGSRIFEGNVSEPSTLLSMVEGIHKQTKGEMPPLFAAKPTVVMDDGIASKENIALLKAKGFSYIVVSRSKPEHITCDDFIEIEEGIKAQSICQGDEIFLDCVSDGKMKKEKANEAIRLYIYYNRRKCRGRATQILIPTLSGRVWCKTWSECSALGSL